MKIKLNGHLKRALPTIPETDDYLDLDLSDCHVEPPIQGRRIFNVKEIFSEEIRNRIVSLILPDCFEEMRTESDNVCICKDLPILQKISGKNIFRIDYAVFQSCHTLESIDFPKVTSICDYVFKECDSLTKVNLPNVKNIGRYSFANCSRLESINLPKTTSIGESAFNYCVSLKSINIPNITSLGDFTFNGCFRLESIDLRWIHEVDETVFERCRSLETVNLFMDLIDDCMPEVCGELFD